MRLIKEFLLKKIKANTFEPLIFINSADKNCTVIQYSVESLSIEDISEFETHLRKQEEVICFIRYKTTNTATEVKTYVSTIIVFLSTCGLDLDTKKAKAKLLCKGYYKFQIVNNIEIPIGCIESHYINHGEVWTIYPKSKTVIEIRDLLLGCFDAVEDKDGNLIKYKFNTLSFFELCEMLGIYLYNNRIANHGSKVQKSDKVLIKVENNLAYITDPAAIKTMFVDIINKYKSTDFELGYFSELHRKAWDKVARGLFYIDYISNTLPTHSEIGFNVFENAVYAVYADCIIKIKDGKFEILGLNDLDFVIWRSCVKRDSLGNPIPMLGVDLYSKDNIYNNDIAKHCENVSKSDRKTDADKDYSFKVFQNTLAYLCTKYKDMSCAKAVIFQDLQISFDGERNGRTGKGILSYAVSYFVNTVRRQGMDLKKDRFALSGVNLDTDVLIDPELSKDFSFDDWLENVTGSWTIENKGKDAIEVPASHTPKLLFITNQIIAGGDPSTDERKHTLEFGKFYTEDNPPKKVFGRDLFGEGWTVEDWQKYHCFMLNNIKDYQLTGLLKPKLINSGVRELIQSTNSSFVEFMNLQVTNDIGIFASTAMYNKFKSFDGGVNSQTTLTQFGRWVKKWFKSNNYTIADTRQDGVTVYKYTKNKEVKQSYVYESTIPPMPKEVNLKDLISTGKKYEPDFQ